MAATRQVDRRSLTGGAGGSELARRPPRPPRTDAGVPVAFGYVRVSSTWPPATRAERVRMLEAAAQRCGWVLGETFVEDEPASPHLAYTHLRVATVTAYGQDSAPVAVLVVSPSEFADSRDRADELRARFERETRVPIVVASTLRVPLDNPPVWPSAPVWRDLVTSPSTSPPPHLVARRAR